MPNTSPIETVADAICEASGAWIAEPLHRMAYEDMARAALSVVDKGVIDPEWHCYS